MEDNTAGMFPLSQREALHHDIIKELNNPLHRLYPYCDEREYVSYVAFTLLSLLWRKEDTIVSYPSPGLPAGMEDAPPAALTAFLDEQNDIVHQTRVELETLILIYSPRTVTEALLLLPHWGVTQYIASNWGPVEKHYGTHEDGYTVILTKEGDYAIRDAPPSPSGFSSSP